MNRLDRNEHHVVFFVADLHRNRLKIGRTNGLKPKEQINVSTGQLPKRLTDVLSG